MFKLIAALKVAAPATIVVLSTSACSDPTAPLRAEWRKCVENAFRENAKTTDRAKAADAAFPSCQSQEDAMFRKAAETNPDVNRARDDLRQREKGRLLKQS
jgi:hypothetical protein